MRKCEVDFHQIGYSSRQLPAINVKVYKSFRDTKEQVIEKFGCSAEDADKAVEIAFDSHAQQFWDEVQEVAEDCFGKGVTVYSEGRSAGWLVVEGLDDFESWDAVAVSKWTRFDKAIREQIDYLTSSDSMVETIEANQYFKHGSEQYNLLDRDGETLCVADLKREAIEAGYGPVVRP